jgi:predicted permease
MLARLRSFARTLLGRDRFEHELRDEMRFHIEARAEDLLRTGLDRDSAMRKARMEFGTVDAIADDCRQSRGVRWIDEFTGDVRYALRLMRKAPGFTTAAVLSLALGIGANTAIFSLMNAVLLRTLPVQNPQELVYFAHGLDPDRAGISSNYPLYERFKTLDPMFNGITAYSSTGFTVRTPEGLDIASGLWASGNFHGVLGVPMAIGRGFSAEVDRAPGRAPIAVISHAYWARRFGRAPSVLERTLTINGRPLTIVGVTAPEFTGPTPGLNPDVTLPISVRALDEPKWLDMKDTYTNLSIVGRLRAGTSADAVLAATDTVFQQYMSEEENAWIRKMASDDFARAQLTPADKGRGPLRRQYETALKVLMGMVAAVLLIASVNVANLLLVRSAARAKEVAIRLCVGGPRSRIVRQFLTESLMLALIGGALGVLAASWGTSAIMRLFDANETPLMLDVAPDLRVLAFAMAVSLVTGIAFGLVPALRSTRVDLTPALKDATTSPASRRWSMSHVLVGTQVALSLVVLVVAALLVRSLVNLRAQDAGFVNGNLLLVTIDTSGSLKPDARLPLYLELLSRLRESPGVVSVAGSKSTPIHTSGDARALVVPPEVPDTIEARAAFANLITPEYFDTLGIKLLHGRQLTDLDNAGSAHVAVVNETMAKFVAGNGDPIGKTFAFRGNPKDQITIVGVVQNTHQMNLREAPPRTVYSPITQAPSAPSYFQVEIRTASDPAAMTASVRQIVRSVSGDLVMRYVRTMDQQIDASLVRERLLSTLSAGFALLALVLSAVGLYGVMSYSVTRRSREIGIRMALGAARGQVLRQVLMQTMSIAAVGTAVGLLGAVAATRTLHAFLFGLSGRDPVTLAAVAIALLLVSTAAGLLPARKAASLNPVQAIKAE